MFDSIKKFFLGDKREVRRVVENNIIGRLSFDDDIEAWESVVNIQGMKIKFHISGDWSKERDIIAPSSSLIEEAEKIVRHFNDFSESVAGFVEEQIRSVPDLREWSDEIRSLKISQVHFYWADRPKDGEIIFSSEALEKASNTRIWACAIKDGMPAPMLSFSS